MAVQHTQTTAAGSAGRWTRVLRYRGPLGGHERRFLSHSQKQVACLACGRVSPTGRLRIVDQQQDSAAVLLCADTRCNSSALVSA